MVGLLLQITPDKWGPVPVSVHKAGWIFFGVGLFVMVWAAYKTWLLTHTKRTTKIDNNSQPGAGVSSFNNDVHGDGY